MDKFKETDSVTEQLLQARENRLQQKLKLVAEGYHLISLQLNIPGWPKSNDLLKQFSNKIDGIFEVYYNSRLLLKKWDSKHVYSDAAGDSIIYLFNKDIVLAKELKALTESFESDFKLGRIVDLDVLSAEGIPISSGKAKPCFVCSKSAEVCRKNQNHTISEVRQAMLVAVGKYLNEEKATKLIQKVTGLAVNALLYEVSLSPKPGLVCRNSAGAHTDMDYLTFLNSTSAISPYFIEIGRLAIDCKLKDVSCTLPYIREIGLKMERDMELVTAGVNTHKGAIFLMAISCFAAIRTINTIGTLKISAFSSIIQQLTRGMVQRELCVVNEAMDLTHGQKCFMRYGLQGAGARGEAEQGLPTVLHHGLPYLNRLSKETLLGRVDQDVQSILIPVLLKIMTVNNDTNVLYRHSRQVLDVLKKKAQEALVDWNNGNQETYMQLVVWCKEQKISSGGSADLLAVTVLLHFIKTEFS